MCIHLCIHAQVHICTQTHTHTLVLSEARVPFLSESLSLSQTHTHTHTHTRTHWQWTIWVQGREVGSAAHEQEHSAVDRHNSAQRAASREQRSRCRGACHAWLVSPTSRCGPRARRFHSRRSNELIRGSRVGALIIQDSTLSFRERAVCFSVFGAPIVHHCCDHALSHIMLPHAQEVEPSLDLCQQGVNGSVSARGQRREVGKSGPLA